MIKLPIDSQYKGLKLNKSKKNSKNSFRIDDIPTLQFNKFNIMK